MANKNEIVISIDEYKELLLKYKSAYQIEKAVKNSEVYKIEKGI